MKGPQWKPEEDAVVHELYSSYNWAEMERRLPGRTRKGIKGRAAKLGVFEEKEPPWSDVDRETLRESFAHAKLSVIAALLGRTENSVKIKACRIGLRRRQRSTLTPSQIGRMMGICSKIVQRWIRRRLLPARRAPTQRKIQLVEVNDLVAFLKSHPESWDARRCPDLHVKLGLTRKRGEAAVIDRPVWLKDKLGADNRRGPQGRRWTLTEDRQLVGHLKRGLPYQTVGKLMGRTKEAIDHRVHRLGRRLWELAKRTG